MVTYRMGISFWTGQTSFDEADRRKHPKWNRILMRAGISTWAKWKKKERMRLKKERKRKRKREKRSEAGQRFFWEVGDVDDRWKSGSHGAAERG